MADYILISTSQIDSSRSTSMQRSKAISRLEEELGQVVLSDNSAKAGPSKLSQKAWWQAQGVPRTCGE